jgi:poly-gamma-glutamate capsule biosynthesis protein CapA/YwtB (metallophosphatase superfamily)
LGKTDTAIPAHPSGSEEVEKYKNNFVFLSIPDLSFQEVER